LCNDTAQEFFVVAPFEGVMDVREEGVCVAGLGCGGFGVGWSELLCFVEEQREELSGTKLGLLGENLVQQGVGFFGAVFAAGDASQEQSGACPGHAFAKGVSSGSRLVETAQAFRLGVGKGH
jgi:hypothetical protein